ncbi:MAG: hypothetical protein KGM16_03070 [Bacteroidota bacterium]|nr:hypothetical protein [Bacteroidota bacterium]
MKIIIAIRLFLFLLTSLITITVFGQLLPDPGGDPIHAVDSVSQISDMRSPNPKLKEARNGSFSKSHLPQSKKTLPDATAGNQEKKQEQDFKKTCCELLLTGVDIYKLN